MSGIDWLYNISPDYHVKFTKINLPGDQYFVVVIQGNPAIPSNFDGSSGVFIQEMILTGDKLTTAQREYTQQMIAGNDVDATPLFSHGNSLYERKRGHYVSLTAFPK